MSKLDLLAPDLTKLSDDELLALVRQARESRKVSKRVQRTTTKKSRVKTADKLKGLLAGLSAEDRAKLLKGK